MGKNFFEGIRTDDDVKKAVYEVFKNSSNDLAKKLIYSLSYYLWKTAPKHEQNRVMLRYILSNWENRDIGKLYNENKCKYDIEEAITSLEEVKNVVGGNMRKVGKDAFALLNPLEIEELTQAIDTWKSFDKDSAIIYSWRANAYFAIGDYNSAIYDMNKMLEYDPDSSFAKSKKRYFLLSAVRGEDVKVSNGITSGKIADDSQYEDTQTEKEKQVEKEDKIIIQIDPLLDDGQSE